MTDVLRYLSLIVMFAGLLIYLLVNSYPKVEAIAKDMFWTGLLAFLLSSKLP